MLYLTDFFRDIGAQSCTIFEQIPSDGDVSNRSAISTIILRASTDNSLNDYERAIEDGVNVVRAVSVFNFRTFLRI